MSQQTADARPAGAIVLAVIVTAGAVFYFCLGLWLAFFDVPTVHNSDPSLAELPDWVPLVNGLLSLTLGLLYLILLRMVLGRTNSAFPMVQAIAFVNLVFGFFRLPAGMIAIAVSALIFTVSNNAATKQWLRRD
jgi:hypothetical protein